MTEGLLRTWSASCRSSPVLANQEIELLFDLVEMEPVLLDAVVLDPGYQEKQQKRLLERSAEVSRPMQLHGSDLLQQLD
jgi:hypothetical protein